MKRIKKIINVLIAVAVFNIPFIFPSSPLIIGLYTIGLLTVTIGVYKLLEKINH